MDKYTFRKILYLTIICVISFALLTTSVVYAWLTINASLNQDGLKITAKVLPSLVISKTSADDALKKSLDNSASFSTSSTFTISDGKKFLPCTHYDTLNTTEHSEFTAGLMYLQNTGDVSQTTGLAPKYTYASVEAIENDDKLYYRIEETIYIASSKSDFTDCKLIASMTGSYKDENSNTLSDTNLKSFQAASVDFYLDGTFVGTLNVAGLNPLINDGSTPQTSLNLFNKMTDTECKGTISTSSAHTIKLVFYFDGSLLESSGQAYVASKTATADFAVLNITFSVS